VNLEVHFLDKKKQKKSTNKTKMDMFHATSRHEVGKYFAYAIEWESTTAHMLAANFN
jgi:hypothetical protein